MATIDSLVEATIVGDDDLLLIDQGGEGKKLKKGNLKIDADNVSKRGGGSVQDFIDELYSRSYAEAGYNLVDGSFEAGGTVTSATDVLLYEATGIAYLWLGALPKVVPAGSTPASTGGIDLGAWVGAAHSNAEERLLGVGAKIYRGSNGRYVQNGDVVPVGTTHLAVLINGKVETVEARSSSGGLLTQGLVSELNTSVLPYTVNVGGSDFYLGDYNEYYPSFAWFLLNGGSASNVFNNAMATQSHVIEFGTGRWSISTPEGTRPSSKSIKGKGQNQTIINAESDGLITIDLYGNGFSVKDMSITDNNFSSTGLRLGNNIGVNQNAKFGEVKRVRFNGNLVGLDLPNSYYNYFEDLMFTGRSALECLSIRIGEDGFIGYCGSLTFNKTYHASGRSFLQLLTHVSNTIYFHDTTVEAAYRGIENKGRLTFKGGYFGDGDRYTRPDGSAEVESGFTYKGTLNSIGKFYDIDQFSGFHPVPYDDNRITSQIVLEDTATIVLNNSNITVGNQNFNDGKNRYCYVYTAEEGTVCEFNDVVCFQPSVNSIANQCPFYFYPDFTPLRSLNPISNYIVNGTFSDEALNAEYASHESIATRGGVTSFDSTYMNQHGGATLIHTGRYGFFIRYQVPPELVGKEMALQVWCIDVGANTNSPGILLDGSDMTLDDGTSTGNVFFLKPATSYGKAGRTPRRDTYKVIPTKENGRICINLNYFSLPGGGTPEPQIKLSSLVLTESENIWKLDRVRDVSNKPRSNGTTANRPKVPVKYETYFDTTLGYSINWNGVTWVNSSGVVV